eukprot:2560962-Karenia_brevis.AAC.1
MVLKAPSNTLRTLLSARSASGVCLPWVSLVTKDMRDLKRFHSSKLAEMGDPEDFWQQWVTVITEHTAEWKMLVKEFMYTASEVDRNKSAAASAPFTT